METWGNLGLVGEASQRTWKRYIWNRRDPRASSIFRCCIPVDKLESSNLMCIFYLSICSSGSLIRTTCGAMCSLSMQMFRCRWMEQPLGRCTMKSLVTPGMAKAPPITRSHLVAWVWALWVRQSSPFPDGDQSFPQRTAQKMGAPSERY